MPEGPSIVLLKELVDGFTGKAVIETSGNSKIDQSRLLNKKITAFKSWGKHFLICFKGFSFGFIFYYLVVIALIKKKIPPYAYI